MVAGALLAVLVAGGSAAGARCAVHEWLPDPRCTPGTVFAAAGVSEICHRGYARAVRDVPLSLKRSVYSAYGVRRHARGAYEIDHLIPLELGGSNAAANLWPQAAPGFRVKDRLENALHDAVCAQRLDLRLAQREIAHDWRAARVREGVP